jgi:hypothetical protein
MKKLTLHRSARHGAHLPAIGSGAPWGAPPHEDLLLPRRRVTSASPGVSDPPIETSGAWFSDRERATSRLFRALRLVTRDDGTGECL